MPPRIFTREDTHVYLFSNINEPNHPSGGMIRCALREFLSSRKLDCKEPITMHWNKSDSHIFSVVAVSTKQIGIDIEYMKDRPYEKISKRYFHEWEHTDDKEIFYDLWTRKEAYTKHKKGKIAENMKEFMYTPTKGRRIEKHHDRLTPLTDLPSNVVGYIYQ
tara:strand:+ start:193 stop:678 length:486 start_codon:yes stop_codon:yes gene_type:complete